MKIDIDLPKWIRWKVGNRNRIDCYSPMDNWDINKTLTCAKSDAQNILDWNWCELNSRTVKSRLNKIALCVFPLSCCTIAECPYRKNIAAKFIRIVIYQKKFSDSISCGPLEIAYLSFLAFPQNWGKTNGYASEIKGANDMELHFWKKIENPKKTPRVMCSIVETYKMWIFQDDARLWEWVCFNVT